MGKIALYQKERISDLITLPTMLCCSLKKDDFTAYPSFQLENQWGKNGKLVIENQKLEDLAVIMANTLPCFGSEIILEGILNPRAYTENFNGMPVRALEYNVEPKDVGRFYELLCKSKEGYISNI